MKRQLLLTALLLFAVLLLIPNIYATTTNQPTAVISTNITTNEYNTLKTENTVINQRTTASTSWGAVSNANDSQGLNLNDQNTISANINKKSQSTGNIQYAQAAAGDDTSSNVQNNWFTNKNVTESAGRVKNYIENNHKLPSYVTIGTAKVNMPQFLRLLTYGLIQINNGKNNTITLKTVGEPTNSTENIKTGSINKMEYISLAVRIQSYIKSNSRSPNYASSSQGNIGFSSMIYLYSRIMSYHEDNNVLPKTASLKPWTSISNQTSGNQTSGNSADSFTIYQIINASGAVKKFIEANQKLPSSVQINGKQLTITQYFQLMNTCLINIYSKNSTAITVKNTGSASNPIEDLKSGIIYKSDYMDLANRIQNYINSNGKAPNFASSNLGKIRYESLIYLESRILNFYAQNSVLPRYASVSPWNTDESSNYPQYLQATANCPSNSATIINLANSITAGKTTVYDKAAAIFNWVNEHTTYSFYYNTVKGALGTLSSGSANCVDTTHLLIALTRAAGIPARYEHGECIFSDGEFGHVWAQVYVKGKWYYADAISPRNTFGIINNWDTSNWTLIGIYAELPF